MTLVISVIVFLVSIFAPWWLDPFFNRLFMRRPYPRLCLAVMTTAIGFICGAVLAAWTTWKLSGEASVPANTWLVVPLEF